MIDYEWMYRALVRRLVEIADAERSSVTFEDRGMNRTFDYDRVARAHEPNIKEEDDGYTP
jgi:hypothetical protein